MFLSSGEFYEILHDPNLRSNCIRTRNHD